MTSNGEFLIKTFVSVSVTVSTLWREHGSAATYEIIVHWKGGREKGKNHCFQQTWLLYNSFKKNPSRVKYLISIKLNFH